jgi:hypothetical protein
MTIAEDFSVLDHKSPDWFISRRDSELLQELRAHVFQWRKFAADELDEVLLECFAAALGHLSSSRKIGCGYDMQVFGHTSGTHEGSLIIALRPERILMRRFEWPSHSSAADIAQPFETSEMTLDTDGGYDAVAAKAHFHFSLALLRGAFPPTVWVEPDLFRERDL